MPLEAIRDEIHRLLLGGNFFVAPPLALRVQHVADEEIRWEVFRGHLLDAASTRELATFESWHVWLDDPRSGPTAPLISLRLQVEPGRLHATRAILVHGHEAFESAPGVIETRPVQKWAIELVGTIDVVAITPAKFAGELAMLLFQAVVGTGRLPITSLETPLPAYSLGQLGWLPQADPGTAPITCPAALLSAALDSPLPLDWRVKALETSLRAADDDSWPAVLQIALDDASRNGDTAERWSELNAALFNAVALSPYTQFVDRWLELLEQLARHEALGMATVVDMVGRMLRNLCRHLTAFDLTLFHNLGANYPDALFLDGLLKLYLRLAGSEPSLFVPTSTTTDTRRAMLRRRALRQACLLREHYEGHRVPDAPTSMGESARVLPPPLISVPAEQIAQPARRRKQLYAGEPLESLLNETAREILAASSADLAQPAELRELGTALFLDRPLGILKAPGEIDRTPLLSYVACSRTVARRRVSELRRHGWVTSDAADGLLARLDGLPPMGLAMSDVPAGQRPGVVSLADANQVAPDFRLLYTVRGPIDRWLSQYDLTELAAAAPMVVAWLTSVEPRIVVQSSPPGAPPTLRCHDAAGRLRLELGFTDRHNARVQYEWRNGQELPRQLRVLRVDQAGLPECNPVNKNVWLPLKVDDEVHDKEMP